MDKREEVEGEVRRIVSPKPYPIIIECPDGTEMKIHIRAISAEDFQTATDVISDLIQGIMYAAIEGVKMGKAVESKEDFEEAGVFAKDVIGKLRDKLMSFLPWFIKTGTNAKYDDVKKLGYLMPGELLLEIIKFNFGKELMDFISRASGTIKPLMGDGKAIEFVGGLLSKASSSDVDTASTVSEDGASESSSSE